MRKLNLIALLLFVFAPFFLTGCRMGGLRIASALKSAGENRSELQAVLDHYRSTGEKLKYKAAEFLIGGLDGKFTLDGPFMDYYYYLLDSIHKSRSYNRYVFEAFNDSIFSEMSIVPQVSIKEDLRNISSAFLIKRIDDAFSLWGGIDRYNMEFDDFCEYLLPYRIGTEVLEDWFTEYRDFFGPDILTGSPVEFSRTIMDKLPEAHDYSRYPKAMPTLKPSVMLYTEGGSCYDYAVAYADAARAYGIPIAVDFTPQWANHSGGHAWCSIVDNYGTYYWEANQEARPAMENDFWFKLVKAYRRTYYPQSESLAMRLGAGNVPHLLDDACIKDVTDTYIPTVNVIVDSLFEANKSSFVFMSVFNNKDWVPIAGAKRLNREAKFEKIGYPAVFLPVYFKEGVISPAQYPLIVDSTGIHRRMSPEINNLRSVRIDRKYMDYRAMEFVDSLRGGVFEFSNNESFKDAYRLHIPDTVSYNYQTLQVEGTYRFVRFIPKQSNDRGNISEIELYSSDSRKLDGTIIGTYDEPSESYSMDKAFDGEPLTYVENQGNWHPWIGMDLGHPTYIEKICFLARSDDNFIRDGQIYELCYWDQRWVSLGIKVGNRQTQSLIYDNVPDNALLLLHNLSCGTEERLFTYDNGKQVWW